MCEGTREDGSTIEPNDPHWDDLSDVAATARTRPAAWLKQHRIYGDLADTGYFANSFSRWLTLIWYQGCEAALAAYLTDK